MTATRAALEGTRGAALDGFRRGLRVALAALLLVFAALYVLWTWHWPLLGDSTLLHYDVFLMEHGMAPYRDLVAVNLPGSFLVEWLAMHLYGGGSLGWRLFDLTVLAAMGAGLLAIAWPYDWFAGVFSAVLMALIHGRDGVTDTGQRDLTIAALMVIGYAFLFRARRKDSAWAAGLFGFCMVSAGMMKPTTLPLAVLLLAMLAIRKEGKPAGRVLLGGLAGMLLPVAISVGFLVREHATRAFLHSMATVEPYFASLERRPLSYLLVHSLSPLMPLVGVWLALGAMAAWCSWNGWAWPVGAWSAERWERVALLLGALAALGGFVAQGKGFPDQRYSFLVLLLLMIGLDLTRALRERGVRLVLAVLGLGFGCVFLAPQSVAKVKRYDWRNQEYTKMMDGDLTRLGGSRLSGHIQCMDTTTGCDDAFYNLKLMPETGMLMDFLVFGNPEITAVKETRSSFLPRMEAAPPWVIVVASGLFGIHVKGFEKLERWPAFDDFLSKHYRLCVQRTPKTLVNWGGGPPQKPASYRIYVLDDYGPVATGVCKVPGE